MEELNRRMAETAHSSILLVSRDTAWILYRLTHSEYPFIILIVDFLGTSANRASSFALGFVSVNYLSSRVTRTNLSL